eukprot:SAG22_NODE_197_length_15520_cov_116.311264_8_plen_101_part_00
MGAPATLSSEDTKALAAAVGPLAAVENLDFFSMQHFPNRTELFALPPRERVPQAFGCDDGLGDDLGLESEVVRQDQDCKRCSCRVRAAFQWLLKGYALLV